MITFTLEEAERIFAVADLHFEHANIIRYCQRPFGNVGEMNYKLLKNWNETVKPDDTVYHVGDFGYGRYYQDPIYWLYRLHGRVILLEGSHDKKIPRSLMIPYEFLVVEGEKLLLIHNYQDAYRLGLVPRDWDGWIIHGHNHQKRPFIMPYQHRMNVSVEVTNYRPVSLAHIVEIIKNGGGK